MSSDISSMPAVAVTSVKTSVIFASHSAEKEVLMQRRRRDRFETEQANLFHAQRVRPAWMELPLQTREEVTRLVARMFESALKCTSSSS